MVNQFLRIAKRHIHKWWSCNSSVFSGCWPWAQETCTVSGTPSDITAEFFTISHPEDLLYESTKAGESKSATGGKEIQKHDEDGPGGKNQDLRH